MSLWDDAVNSTALTLQTHKSTGLKNDLTDEQAHALAIATLAYVPLTAATAVGIYMLGGRWLMLLSPVVGLAVVVGGLAVSKIPAPKDPAAELS